MLVRIDPESDAPLFAQIAASVRADAAAGRVQPGDRLPAAREIAAALGVNVHTVLHAYQDLRDEGLVELRRGRGAVITAQAATLEALHHDIHDLVARARAAGLPSDALAALVKEIAAHDERHHH
ncbi:GntR family transcriptional regulator [Microbacterium trichothecenolyticum]|uniref:GntR family transcriptional regulator n=1 Tax=Microbacterium trichothecenolyticum TaxID=69370 RepID=UPI000E284D46